jgi:flagellar hook-associated protein 3 FlgL
MTINRVTQSMLTNRSLGHLQSSLSKMAEIQEHLSTGRVLNRPSDNPADSASAMRLRSALAAQQQYVRNAEDGVGRLNTIDSTLQGASDQVRRARDLALQGNNGALGPAAREALAVEIDQIRAGLVQTANTSYLGRPVFGGTTAGSVAFAETAGPPPVTTYAGDGNPVNRTVGEGIVLDAQLSGTQAFGDDGDNVFDHLTALSAALRAGDTVGIGAGIDALKADGDRVATALAEVGTRTSRIELAATRAADAEVGMSNALAEIENADLPATVVELQMQEVAYQAALAATGRVLQPSLLDFLR